MFEAGEASGLHAISEPRVASLTVAPNTRSWHLATRIAFRFAFCYFALYCAPWSGRVTLLDAVPLGGFLAPFFEKPFRLLCPWVAVHIFGLSGSVTQYHPTGSGDTTLDYVQVFCFLVIAALATLFWSVLDRRRLQYRALYPWLRLIVRFTLAFTMLGYGFAKVFPLQFPSPDLSRLTESYGESSPMGLLWTFMGASTTYQMLCGTAEVVSGILLLFRRTSSLGALLMAALMTNIVILNFCFDVGVKLYSSHLLLMAIFLLIPDMSPLWSFFLLRRESMLRGVSIPRFERRWLRHAAVTLQVLIVVSVLFQNVKSSYDWFQETHRTSLDISPLYGIWTVEEPPEPNATKGVAMAPFRRLMIGHVSRIAVRLSDDTLQQFVLNHDRATGTYKLQGLKHTAEFATRVVGQDQMRLQGLFDGKPMDVQLHRSKTPVFVLKSWGFHWISEDSYST